MKLSEVRHGEKFDGFAILKSIKEGTTIKGSTFIDIEVSDNETPKMSVKIWDAGLSDVKISENSLVKIIGKGNLYDEKMQIVVAEDDRGILIRETLPQDNVNILDFVKAAPVDADIMYKYITDSVESLTDQGVKDFTLAILKDFEDTYKVIPASIKVHHDYKSGSLYHIYQMLKAGIAVCDIYSLNRDLVIAGIVLHDIGKCVSFDFSMITGIAPSYNYEGTLNGHIVEGIKILQKYSLDEKKKVLFEHIISSHHYNEEWGAFTAPAFPEAELIHHIDMIDSRMAIFKEEYESLEDNGISKKGVWSLEKRKLVKVAL